MEVGALKCVVAAMKTHDQCPQIQDWGSRALGAGQPNFSEIYKHLVYPSRFRLEEGCVPCQVPYVQGKMMTP